jgi:hypothetical protein
MRTIESEILKALTEVECTPQEHADIPQKVTLHLISIEYMYSETYDLEMHFKGPLKRKFGFTGLN